VFAFEHTLAPDEDPAGHFNQAHIKKPVRCRSTRVPEAFLRPSLDMASSGVPMSADAELAGSSRTTPAPAHCNRWLKPRISAFYHREWASSRMSRL
jgi:hypothetical protein